MVNALALNKVKEYLTRAHLQVALGTDAQNQTYCSKQGTNIYQIGEVSIGQGARTDIHEVTALIRKGELTQEDFMWDYPELYVKYGKSFKEMFTAILKPRSTPPSVIWRWGLTGVGKTRHVVDTHPNLYMKDNTQWWDGYHQQQAIIFDDFDNSIPFKTLLRILDRYDYPCQIKGSYTTLNSPFIYITCDKPPSHFWKGAELAQISRRLTSVLEII
jgi:hypothetical protein